MASSKKGALLRTLAYRQDRCAFDDVTDVQPLPSRPARPEADLIAAAEKLRWIAAAPVPGFQILLPRGVFVRDTVLATADRLMRDAGALHYRFPLVFPGDVEAGPLTELTAKFGGDIFACT